MARHIEFNPDKCVGCRACELICSLVKEGGFIPNLARIRVERSGVQKLEGFVCRQCDDPPCAKVCPVKAISKDKDGRVLIDESKCIGCGACVRACPYHDMFFDSEKKKAIKCDLCGGHPNCIPMCMHGAIKLVEK